MLLTPFCLTLTCLRVSPDRSQFFRYDSVSLSCDSQSNLTGWKVKRKTLKGGVKTCTSSWGSTSLGSTCIIGKAYPSDSGEYWCQSGDGETSNGINITITDRTVILESPALPVSSGAAVVLRCRAEPNASNHSFNFYKDDRPISSSSAGQMTIHGASKSDEGLYKCGIAGGGESEGSWLAVEASLSTSTSAPSAASDSASISRLLCHLVVGTPYLLSTILLGLVYRDRKRATRTVTERRRSNDVIMEVVM